MNISVTDTQLNYLLLNLLLTIIITKRNVICFIKVNNKKKIKKKKRLKLIYTYVQLKIVCKFKIISL